jgi:hypothetical protein
VYDPKNEMRGVIDVAVVIKYTTTNTSVGHIKTRSSVDAADDRGTLRCSIHRTSQAAAITAAMERSKSSLSASKPRREYMLKNNGVTTMTVNHPASMIRSHKTPSLLDGMIFSLDWPSLSEDTRRGTRSHLVLQWSV